VAKHEPARAIAWRSEAPNESDGPFLRRGQPPHLLWAALDRFHQPQTNCIHGSELDRQPRNRIRYHDTEQAIPEEVTAASTHELEPKPQDGETIEAFARSVMLS
jgi:hypothetical protein